MENALMKGRRLSISNIAWPANQDDEALSLVAELGFDGIEVAPMKVFGDLHALSSEAIRSYRRKVEDYGLSISALQALLFGVPGAHLFESSEKRERMEAHLRYMAEIANELGAQACVFGSPTLRNPGTRPMNEALEVAEDFLRSVAQDYATRDVELCFEANPPLYGCRFITRTEEAFELVKRVNVPGLALQLDTGTIFINGEDPEIVSRVQPRIGHVHVSEPNLVPVGTAGTNHAAVAEALKRTAYSHWISIEMKAVHDWRGAISDAYTFVRSLY